MVRWAQISPFKDQIRIRDRVFGELWWSGLQRQPLSSCILFADCHAVHDKVLQRALSCMQLVSEAGWMRRQPKASSVKRAAKVNKRRQHLGPTKLA